MVRKENSLWNMLRILIVTLLIFGLAAGTASASTSAGTGADTGYNVTINATSATGIPAAVNTIAGANITVSFNNTNATATTWFVNATNMTVSINGSGSPNGTIGINGTFTLNSSVSTPWFNVTVTNAGNSSENATLTGFFFISPVNLGTAGTYGILSSTFTRSGGITAISGDLGATTIDGAGTHTVTNGLTYTPAPAQAGIDQNAALAALALQPCTFDLAGGVDLSLDTSHGTLTVYTPGVYCISGAASIGTAGINLSGTGTYIFRLTGALTSVDQSNVTLTNGALVSNVFWTPVATSLSTNTIFAGTVIQSATPITVGANTVWTGRALAFSNTVTTAGGSITSPVSGSIPVNFVTSMPIKMLNGTGATLVPTSLYYYYNGSTIRINVSLNQTNLNVSGDFSQVGNASLINTSTSYDNGSGEYIYTLSAIAGNVGIGAYPINITATNTTSGAYNVSTNPPVALMNINPQAIDTTLGGTNWTTGIADFTNATLTFEKFTDLNHNIRLGTLEFLGAMNLANTTTATALQDLGNNLNMAMTSMNLNSAANALAAMNVSSRLSFYNLSQYFAGKRASILVDGVPAIRSDGVQVGDGTIDETLVDWSADNNTVNFTTLHWSNMSLESYAANLTNITALSQTKNATENASYILILQNNGTAFDMYNLTIDNNGGASTAALNVSGDIPLGVNETRVLLLNVTNTVAGTFYVNVTARPNNDTSQFSYVNTTTILTSVITLGAPKDTYIDQGSNASNFGTGSVIYVRTWVNQNRRILLTFDTSYIPIGAHITSANLSLYYLNNSGSLSPVGRTYNATALWGNRSNWDETSASWNKYNSTTDWTNPGGDTNGSLITNSTVPAVIGWMNWSVTPQVEYFINNSINVSLEIKDYTENATLGNRKLAEFYSREDSNVSFRPNLTILYTVDTPSYNVSLINVTAVNASALVNVNATYYLNLTNSGNATDSYNLTIDKPSYVIAGVNISTSYYSLGAGQTKIFMLNVTNATSGTVNVNITATSTNNTSKFAYVNTTTIVTPTGSVRAAVDLGTADSFVILAKSGISTTGVTSIVGDIGVSPIDQGALTGFSQTMDSSNEYSTSIYVTGKLYAADYAPPTPAKMTTAVSDMETAYTAAAGRTLPDATELGAGNIGGLTLAPGLYKWGTGVLIPTNVTLSGGADDVWIFQIAQTLDIASATQVILTGGAQAKNIFWQVGGQTTLGTTSVFNGNILDQTAIVLNTGATLNGRALAQTAVTLDANDVNFPSGYVYGVNLTVNPTSGTTNATVNITYTLTLRNTGNVTDIYNLTISSDNASTAALNVTGNITLAANANRTLLLNVTNTSIGTAYVNITARSLGDPTQVDYANTTTEITASPDYGVNLTANTPPGSTNATVNYTYTLTLRNNGTGTDTYNLTIASVGASTAALNVTGDIELAANANRTLLLNVTNTTVGTAYVNVTARSLGDPTKVSIVNTTTEITAAPDYGVNLTVNTQTGETNATVNETYILTLQNNGSGTDTYSLTVASVGASTAALNVTGNIELATNEIRILLLNVTNATAGMAYVNVTAQSLGDSTKVSIVNTTTTINTAPTRGVNLTNISALAGTNTTNVNVTYVFRLTNNGTSEDTYTLALSGDSPTVAALNNSSVTLAASASRIITLNVTDSTGGIFHVNVTATSLDTSKFAYVNTTTYVETSAPDAPTSYWGNVTIGGILSSATINVTSPDGSDVGNTTSFSNGSYRVEVKRNDSNHGDPGVSAGQTITFKVNGVSVHSRTVEASGTNNRLNLSLYNGTLAGSVLKNGTNIGISGATVTITNATFGISTATTDSIGSYRVSLYPGIYIINVSKTGYSDNNSNTKTITANISTTSVIMMNPNTVTITADRTVGSADAPQNVTFNLTVVNTGIEATFVVTNVSTNVTSVTTTPSSLLLNTTTPSGNVFVQVSNTNLGGWPVEVTVTNGSKSASISLNAIMRNSSEANYTNISSNVDDNSNVTGGAYLENTDVTNSTIQNATLINATVQNDATISGNSTLIMNATISGGTITDGTVILGTYEDSYINDSTIGNSTVDSSNLTGSIVRDNASITNSTLTDAVTVDNSTLENVTVSGTSSIRDVASLSDITLGGVTVIGDPNYEYEGLIRAGTGWANYLGINFTTVYADVRISQLVILQTDHDEIALANISTAINDTSVGKSMGFSMTVNASRTIAVNISETFISPDGVGFSSGTKIGNFLVIRTNNTTSTNGRNHTLRLYFDTNPATYTAGVHINYFNTTTLTWVPLATTAEGNVSGLWFVEAAPPHFSTFALLGTYTSGGGTTTSSGSGGGGGGGGGKSNENASNIELIEKYDMQISKDTMTSYRFVHAKNPIMFLNITGATSLGIITASIEVLKNTSTLVNFTPDGLVYKNANIWVGTAGFATPKNIKDAFIKFRIDNAWMSANGVSASDIVLKKWDGTRWIDLETKVVSKDDTNSYFEGWTNSFSPFAIVAKTAGATPTVTTPTPAGTPAPGATTTGKPGTTGGVGGIPTWLIGLIILVIIGAVAYYFMVVKKKE